MGKQKKKGGKQTRKKKDTPKDVEPEYLGTIEPEIYEEVQETSTQVEQTIAEPQTSKQLESPVEVSQTEEILPAGVTDKPNGEPDEPEGEVELSEDHQPKQKKHRGPTKMKNIVKDPTVREKVDYNLMGDPYGPGSVKLSSYVGTLVREHVPVIIEIWKHVSQDIKTVLWKSVQVTGCPFQCVIFIDCSVSILMVSYFAGKV